MTTMTIEHLTDMIMAIGLQPGDIIPYVTDRGSLTFVRFDRQSSLLDHHPTRMVVRRGAKSMNRLDGGDWEIAVRPDAQGKSAKAAEIIITFNDLHKMASKCIPEVPMHPDSELNASGNTRSAIFNILLLCREFKAQKGQTDSNYTKLVWCPDRPDDTKGVKIWTPPPRRCITAPQAQRALDILTKHGVYSRALLEDVVTSLRSGNIALVGHPGCGKNHLVKGISKAFGVDILYAEANDNWHPNTLTRMTHAANGAITTMDGDFVRSIRMCQESIRSTGRPTWLFIDELTRANPDKVFGQMMTFLGEDMMESGKTFIIPEDPLRERLSIPDDFRIIVAYNNRDGDTITNPSDAILRRFNPCYINDPANDTTGLSSQQEWEFMLSRIPGRADMSVSETDQAMQALKMSEVAIRTALGSFRAVAGEMGTSALQSWMHSICTRSLFFVSGCPVEMADRAAQNNILRKMTDSITRQVRHGLIHEASVDTHLAAPIRSAGLLLMADAFTQAVQRGANG